MAKQKLQKMDAITSDFVGFAECVGELTGQDSLESKITAILFIEPNDVAMDELAKMTGYSLPSICNKVRRMEQAGLIIRRTRPGTKKVYLFMEKDPTKVIKNHLKQMQQIRMKIAKEGLPQLIAKYKGKADPEIGRASCRERVYVQV
jgi:DNA-binding transcriptional regulator GbsR (MarR family)